MPQFIMNDMNTPEFAALDEFTRGYIQALFFTNCEGSLFDGTFDPENNSSLPNEAGFSDLDPDALKRIIADCARFQDENASDLEEAYAARDGLAMAYEAENAGMDFWYSRCGHGVGYWDRGLGDVGDRLDKATKAYGERWVNWEAIDGAEAGEPQGIVHMD